MKKIFACLVFSLLTSISVFSQSSAVLSEMIETEKASYAQASYLPAIYANLVSDEASLEDAFKALSDNGYFNENTNSQESLSLSQLSFIYVKVFQIKGGLFCRMFNSPRYAFKELKAQGVLPPEADPAMSVSGHDVIDIFNQCLEMVGGNE